MLILFTSLKAEGTVFTGVSHSVYRVGVRGRGLAYVAGICMHGGMCVWQGVHMHGGMHAWWGHACMGACMAGVCMAGVCASQRACVVGEGCGDCMKNASRLYYASY